MPRLASSVVEAVGIAVKMEDGHEDELAMNFLKGEAEWEPYE